MPPSKVIVTVHGWPDDTSIWDKQVASLHARGYTVVSHELPNFGTAVQARKRPWGYSGAEVVQSLKETVLTAADGAPVILLTHDWGCIFGMSFQRKYPNLVEKMILLDIGSEVNTDPVTLLAIFAYQFWLIIAFLIGGRIGDMMTCACANLFHAPPRQIPRGCHMNYPYFRYWYEALRFYTSPRSVLTARGNKALKQSEESTASGECSSSSGASKSSAATTAEKGGRSCMLPSCPVLFAYGNQGLFGRGKRRVFFHTDKWAAAVNAREGSYAVAVEDAGHWLQLTHPDEVNALLGCFLDGGAAGASLLKQRAHRAARALL